MTFEEAKKLVTRTMPDCVLHKKGSVCYVLKQIPFEEPSVEGRTLYLDGDLRYEIKGQGLSWLQALRYAAKPILEKEEKDARQRQHELQNEKRDFVEFLFEKFHEEFAEWRKPKGTDERQLELPGIGSTPSDGK